MVETLWLHLCKKGCRSCGNSISRSSDLMASINTGNLKLLVFIDAIKSDKMVPY